jgi:predicted site-specific integrase-resolvase
MTAPASPRVLIYARCSTTRQDPRRQIAELRQEADQLGWPIIGVQASASKAGRRGRASATASLHRQPPRRLTHRSRSIIVRAAQSLTYTVAPR